VLAAPCPKCGKPAPVSLAKPDVLVCGCGFQGAPTNEVVSELHHAASALGEIDARHRQLTAAQQRSIANASLRAGIAIAVSVVFMFGVAELYRRPAPAGAAAVFATVIVALVVLRGRSMRTRLAAPFGGTRCRVCGEPIGGSERIVRCHHCAADNLREAGPADDRGSFVERVSRAAMIPGRRR
jgi:hypothetical protein